MWSDWPGSGVCAGEGGRRRGRIGQLEPGWRGLCGLNWGSWTSTPWQRGAIEDAIGPGFGKEVWLRGRLDREQQDAKAG